MQYITNISGGSKVVSALDTYVHTAGASTIYTINVYAQEVPPSGLQITIQQNSTVIAQSSIPAATQPEVQLRALINATIGDSLEVILSSSAVIDQRLNRVKAIIGISQGQVG